MIRVHPFRSVGIRVRSLSRWSTDCHGWGRLTRMRRAVVRGSRFLVLGSRFLSLNPWYDSLMAPFFRKIWLLTAVLLLAGVCGITSVIAVGRTSAAPDAALLDARARWNKRPFDAYRMQLRDRGCRMEVDVHAERVQKTRYATRPCEQPPVAVRDLFDLVERHGSVRRTCVSRGCACDDVLSVRADYHPNLGYPQTIEITLTPTPNWRHADFWQAVWETRSLDACNDLPVGSRVLTVVALTPLP